MSEEVTFQLRHGTQDAEVFDDVVNKNQYRLPDKLPPDSLVIDIGANIGAFAVACLLRGAGTVVCFEPCPLNFQQILKNTSGWPGQVAAFNAAVWRSDRSEKIKFISADKNTACGGVVPVDVAAGMGKLSDGAAEVTAIGLDELLYHATDGGKRRVQLLKIDAEGAEYSILYTSRHLPIVDQLIGETHQYPNAWPGDKFFVNGFTQDEACAAGMKVFLEKQGFSVTQQAESAENNINTLFFATRPTPETVT